MKKFKVSCIIQARMSSSRLPSKILLPGYNKPLLFHLIERLRKSKKLDKIIVATTNEVLDDVIVELCKKNKIKYFRGKLDDLVDRYYKCATKYKMKNIVRITSDCPLINHNLVDEMINSFEKSNVDYLSNLHPPTFPDGFDIEIFNYSSLKKTFLNSKKNYEREHVTPYIWDNPNKFKIKNFNFKNKVNLSSKYRLTLDYPEDYYVLWNIFNRIYPKNKNFDLKDIFKFLKSNKEILINNSLIKVNWYRNHLKKLKTISQNDTNLKGLKK